MSVKPTPPAARKRQLGLPSSTEPWLTLHLRCAAPARATARAALLLHGATLSGFIFGVPVAGASLQDRLAARGWASYALDARGFGQSTRPWPGEPQCDPDRPFGGAAVSVGDVADAVRFLRGVAGHTEVALIGFSWGAICAGCFAAQRGELIDKLVLCAPIYAARNLPWLQHLADPADVSRLNPAFGAYRWTTAADLQARWDGDIPIADKSAWREPGVLRAVLDGALADDPLSSTRTPPAFRAPNGPFADLFEAYSGRPPFDAAAIQVATLIVRGDADTTASDADAHHLLGQLGGRDKDYRIIPAGSHFQCLERSMPALTDTCLDFLD